MINTREFQYNESVLTKPTTIEIRYEVVLSALESHSKNINTPCIQMKP